MYLTFIILITILVIVFSIYQISGWKKLAPWVPSNLGLLNKALTELNLPADTTFIDLGAGDGRAVFLAAKKFHFKATGIELSPIIWLWSKIRQLLSGNNAVKLILGDSAKHNLKNYQVIYLYGLPENLAKQTGAKLETEVSSGSYVISYNFKLKNRQPLKSYTDKWRSLFVYQF